jgi:hypothetical protein
MSKIPKWMNGSQLMDRWGLDAYTIIDLILNHGFPVYGWNHRLFNPNLGPHAWMAGGPWRGLMRADLTQISAMVSEDEQKDAMGILKFKNSDIKAYELEFPELFTDKPKGKSTKKLRPNQEHKQQCREAVKELWREDQTITIANMIHKDEIVKACNGEKYADKTIRRWINDLCPNRSPGRRKGT